MKIRAASPDDAAVQSQIYAPYVTASAISFEAVPPAPDEMQARLEAGADLYPWIVACDEDGAVAGYAYASPFRARAAYLYSVETSIYVGDQAQGRGAGTLLYRRLLAILTAQGFTQAIAAVTLPNEASARFHEKLGFERAGTYRQVGYKLGQWHDVGLWQRALAMPADPPAAPRPYGENDFQSVQRR